MFNKTISGSPFIISSFELTKTPFLNHYIQGTIGSTMNKKIQGFSNTLSTKATIKATIGEHIERFSSVKNYYKNDLPSTNPYLEGFNLIDGSTIKVRADDIFLTRDLPIFKYSSNEDTNYTDSCGWAAHTQSLAAIESAFSEFIERQSLIYFWLSKKMPLTLNLNFLEQEEDLKTKKLVNFVSGHVEKLYMFNISILEGYYVIATLGFNGAAFSIGLGASHNIYNALSSSLNEFMMILDASISQQVNPTVSNDSDNIYTDRFYSMDVDLFKECYAFCFDSIHEYTYTGSNDQVIQSIIARAVEKLNIDIYAIYIENPLKKPNIKVLKIFSPDAYPHMLTDILNPDEFLITKSLPESTFPNRFKPIPFA